MSCAQLTIREAPPCPQHRPSSCTTSAYLARRLRRARPPHHRLRGAADRPGREERGRQVHAGPPRHGAAPPHVRLRLDVRHGGPPAAAAARASRRHRRGPARRRSRTDGPPGACSAVTRRRGTSRRSATTGTSRSGPPPPSPTVPGLDGDDLDRPVATLSGGQAVLTAVAGIRLRGRPIALLDEPTNNLDRRARAALLDLVDTWRGTLVVVSHDRELLEHVDETVELRSGSATVFGGTFSAYEEHLAVQQAAVAREVRVAEQRHRAEQRQRIEAETKIARRARAGREAARSMPKILANEQRKQAEQTAGRLRAAHGSAEEHALAAVREAELRLRDDEALHVACPTRASRRRGGSRPSRCAGGTPSCRAGAGGRHRGQRRRQDDPARPARGRPGCSCTSVAGHRRGAARRPDRSTWPNAGTDSTTTPRCSTTSGGRLARARRELRNRLARLLVRGDTVDRPVCGRCRVGSASAWRSRPSSSPTRRPQLLVLDEPTNDLDLTSVDQLGTRCGRNRGALVVVSHDETFLDRLDLTDGGRAWPDGEPALRGRAGLGLRTAADPRAPTASGRPDRQGLDRAALRQVDHGADRRGDVLGREVVGGVRSPRRASRSGHAACPESVRPGCTLDTRTPFARSSSRRASAKARSANFDAA